MDILIVGLFFGIAVAFSMLALKHEYIPFAAAAGIMLILMGWLITDTGNIERTFCMDVVNSTIENTTSGITNYTNSITCHTVTYTIARNYMTGIGLVIALAGIAIFMTTVEDARKT